MQKRMFGALVALVAVGLGLTGCSGGSASSPNQPPVRAADSVVASVRSAGASSSGNDVGLQKHLDAVNKFMASRGGGKILGTKSVPFQKAGAATGRAPAFTGALAHAPEGMRAGSPAIQRAGLFVPAAQDGFGNNCTLYVTLGFTYRSNTYSSMYNYSTTYCAVGVPTIEMYMGILKEDTITGGETWVAQPDPAIGGGQELQSEAEYQCPTGNVSGFMAETDGYLWDSTGTEYTASAADPGAGEFTRYNCG